MAEKTSRASIAATILAGGKATRLGGIAKGALEVADGVTIVERLISELERAGIEDIIISANEPEPYKRCGREIVADIRTGIGPPGGVEAALTYLHGRCGAVIFVPCDLPGISAGEITALIDAFVAGESAVMVAETASSFWHSLCTVVHIDSLGTISAAIDSGERRVRNVWRQLGVSTVHFDDDAAFANINTPQDLDGWRESKT